MLGTSFLDIHQDHAEVRSSFQYCSISLEQTSLLFFVFGCLSSKPCSCYDFHLIFVWLPKFACAESFAALSFLISLSLMLSWVSTDIVSFLIDLCGGLAYCCSSLVYPFAPTIYADIHVVVVDANVCLCLLVQK